jgi:hypothetical protein
MIMAHATDNSRQRRGGCSIGPVKTILFHLGQLCFWETFGTLQYAKSTSSFVCGLKLDGGSGAVSYWDCEGSRREFFELFVVSTAIAKLERNKVPETLLRS